MKKNFDIIIPKKKISKINELSVTIFFAVG